jgi:hypothetical protein
VANCRHNDPVATDGNGAAHADFWPGYYSRTHVAATEFSYAAVMAGLRAGRIWVDHGGLISGLDVRVFSDERWVALGETLVGSRGSPLRLSITIDLATMPNRAGLLPRLARVDVVRGIVTGPVVDRDAMTTAHTRVVASFDVDPAWDRASIGYDLGPLDQPSYVRLRGTDGNRSSPGYLEESTDPLGPAMDVPGDSDPWTDLWFYSNPIWMLPKP